MMQDLIKQLVDNKFDFYLRTNLEFNEKEYRDLIDLLKLIGRQTSDSSYIPKELAFNLYFIPYVVRNSLDFLIENSKDTQLIDKTEESWIEIDCLVQACLGG